MAVQHSPGSHRKHRFLSDSLQPIRVAKTSAIALQSFFFFSFSPCPMRTYHSAGGRKCSLVQGVQGLKTRKLLGSGIGRRRAQSTTASDRSGGTSSESQSRAGNCGGAGARCCQRRSHGAHRGSGGGGGGSHHDSTEAKVDRRGGSCRGQLEKWNECDAR